MSEQEWDKLQALGETLKAINSLRQEGVNDPTIGELSEKLGVDPLKVEEYVDWVLDAREYKMILEFHDPESNADELRV